MQKSWPCIAGPASPNFDVLPPGSGAKSEVLASTSIKHSNIMEHLYNRVKSRIKQLIPN